MTVASVEQGGLTAVAMSGGLDSSVTAWLLAQRGQPVIGLSMLLWDHSGTPRNGRCCGALDLGDARRVAQQAGIPHYTLRLDEEFRRAVVDPFVDDYLAGRTPSPCVRCNTWIKFDLLLERARSFGAERLATGHYARIVAGPNGPELHRAVDLDKDQSYYLFELSAEQLAAAEFPLGGMTKSQTRALAVEAGLVVAGKSESMEVCFVEGSVRDFVETEAARRAAVGVPPSPASAQVHTAAVRPVSAGAPSAALSPASSPGPAAGLGQPARLVDSAGETRGWGEPFYRYTVGQRRGLGIAAPNPLYVLAIEPAENRVVVGPEQALRAPGLRGERLHWIGDPPPARAAGSDGGDRSEGGDCREGGIQATVRIRSRHSGVAARIHPGARPGEVEVVFAEPQRGVTPGQAAVFYRGSRVLGGCWITGRLD